jgi:isoquinoline 1-oxidoreductase subunit beta
MNRFDDLRRGTRDRPERFQLDRRSLMIGGGAAAGLFVAWAVWPKDERPGINASEDEAILSHYVKVSSDGRVTILCPQAELGQGAYTLIAQIAADELGADWRTIAVEPAPIASVYANALFVAEDAAAVTPRIGVPEDVAAWTGWRQLDLDGSAAAMLTGGSTTIRNFADPVRAAAATARTALCMAAAERWDVAWEACTTSDGFVRHGNRRLRFGELAAAAAQQDPPTIPAFRPRGDDDDALLGRPLPRLDLPAKIDGSLNYSGDVRLPDMVFAAIRQGPHGDSRLLRYSRAAGERVRGFVSAVRHDRWLAAVATNGWAAQRALDAMAPVFRTAGTLASTTMINRRLSAALRSFDGVRISEMGDVAEAMRARPVLRADYYSAPSLHAPIETRTATAQPDGGRMRVWVATQAPGFCRAAIAAALGIDPGDVALYPMPAGGAFGAAFDHDVAVQAALIARSLDRPVQLCWSRAEETLRDLPRAPARARLHGSLSSGATIDAWHTAIATPASRHEFRARLTGVKADAARRDSAGAADAAAIGGAAPPYRIPHSAIDHLPVDIGLPVGQLRGGSEGFTHFFTEAFLDELAALAGVDPLSFRIGMLGDHPRLVRCLQTVTAMGSWNGGGTGSGEGIACGILRGSYVAIMARARRSERGLLVEHLYAAVDCGATVNPNIARQQIEGGMVFGLAAATGATTHYRRGLARARRLSELNLPTLAKLPQISVELLTSDAEAGGIGDIAVPLVAPAIANALFTTTGRRIRRLPLNDRPAP